jgi:hypothetical protein
MLVKLAHQHSEHEQSNQKADEEEGKFMGERPIENSNSSGDDVIESYSKQKTHKSESTEHSNGIEHCRRKESKK